MTAYLWMVGPGVEAMLRRSIESVRRVEEAPVIAVSYRAGFDFEGIAHDYKFPADLEECSGGDVLTKLALLVIQSGAQTVVRISPEIIVTAPAKRPRAMAAGSFLVNEYLPNISVLATRYWTMRGASAMRLFREARMETMGSEEFLPTAEGITWDTHDLGPGFLAGFDFQSGGDPARYRRARAISFHNTLPAHLGPEARVEAMDWLLQALSTDEPVAPWRSVPAIPPVGPVLTVQPLPVDIVVTAHAPYLPYLPEVIAGWNREDPGGKKLLVLDNVDAYHVAPEGWTVIRGNWSHPSGARNAALELCTSEWVHYWDADNEVPVGIRDNMECLRFAFSGSSKWIGYFGPCIGSNEYLDSRNFCAVDTNGLWRVQAIRLALGWPDAWLEDWSLGTRLQSIGYELRHWDSGTVRRSHAEQRGLSSPVQERTWSARSITIITLQRTEDLWNDWAPGLRQIDLPPDVRLIVVAESAELANTIRRAQLPPQITALTVITAPGEMVRFNEVSEVLRHSRVSGLYLLAARHIARDTSLVLTWEDDVLPTRRDAIRLLSDAMPIQSNVGAVAGAYPGRNNPLYAVASESFDKWLAPPWSWVTMNGGPVDTPAVGAGFTLWRPSVLELACNGWKQKPEIPWGWDMCASKASIDTGRRNLLHCGVLCAHRAA